MGSSFCTQIEPYISRPSDSDLVRCDRHEWTNEYGHHYALDYCTLGKKPEAVYVDLRECHDKVCYTIHDVSCPDDHVLVSIEVVAVRDGDGSYTYGPIKVSESGEKFTERRRSSMGSELLFLSYVRGRRTNQLALYRRREEYEVVFDSKSPLVLLHNRVRISCDPLKGLVANFTENNATDEKVSRSRLKGDAGSATSLGNNTINGPSVSYSQDDVISNTGRSQGLLNDSNLRDCQIHIEGARFQFKGSQNP